MGTLALSIGVASGGASPGPVLAAEATLASTAARSEDISTSTLEKAHGIRITQIAVTGGGGLVDLRFTILDPAKARTLFQDHGTPPRLLVEGSTVELQAPMHGAMRNVRLQKDAAGFIIYPNARSAIQPGTRVAVAFGDVRLEPIAAK